MKENRCRASLGSAESDNKALHGSRAHEIAYDTLYWPLPACDHGDESCNWQ